MAICIRRGALSSRMLLYLRSPRHFSNLSHLSYLISDRSTSEAPLFGYRRGSDGLRCDPFFFVNRRGFAKGKKSKKEDDGDTIQAVPDMGPVKSTALSQMEDAITALSRELAKLRTGRASAGMLDHVTVETNSGKLSLNHVAVVSVLDAQTLSVMPYDPNALKTIERAIISSPLGLNPKADGERLIAAIPPLTKENIEALCKVVTKSAEEVKQSIRRARQKALDSIKKAASAMPKDDVKRLEKEIEEMTKKFVKSAEDICRAKEKEIGGK
ncbi:uncharacterized protein LOC109830543 [Asparagus officinalis]|uniref:uncharacterized protein LOC109830543 n=1 Tax=Asparagus officinalis TaxID=4686 RepID=UPI00098E52F7|nr:uncharacterized protein LOC109830543 [Asparagus officinalis]